MIWLAGVLCRLLLALHDVLVALLEAGSRAVDGSARRVVLRGHRLGGAQKTWQERRS